MMLLGICAPRTIRVRNIIRTLCAQLNARHICMHAPVNRAIAGLLNETEHEVAHHIEPHRHYKQFGLNAGELDQKISLMLRSGNPLCFIEEAEKLMAEYANTLTNRLFNGHIISGINTHTECAWLRARGGKLIHIYDTACPSEFNHQPKHADDFEINAGTADENYLTQLAADIERAQQQEAA